MRKCFALVLALVLMSAVFAGVGSAESSQIDWQAYSGTKLQVMFNQHNYQKAITDYGKMEEFEKLTGIDVEFSVTPEENYFDKLNIALSSKSGEPDVFMTGAYQVWEYASAGYMEPLENYISDPTKTEASYDFADFYPGVVGTLAWDCIAGHPVGSGSQWALPMGYELNNIAYNKKYFDENNLKLPTTTSELLELSKGLQGWSGAGSYGIAVRGTRNWATIHPAYMTLFSTWGAKDFEIEDGRLVCKLDSEEAIAMTDYWVKLVVEGSSPQWATFTWYEAGAHLGAGVAGILYDATCNGYFQNYPEGASAQAGNLAWHPGVVPDGMGLTENDIKSNVWVWSMGMNVNSDNKGAAWLFLQYFTSPEFMLFSGTEGACADSPRVSVADSEAYVSVVGKSTGYLEALAVLLPKATIQFTPQPYFFETTTEWAATLQDLVEAYRTTGSCDTAGAMKALKAKLDIAVEDIQVG
ncbi:ABC transporter substrate-binding protein [Bacillota bacterium Meth-B3]|nr:extracellular solute-binding protein [Christensenellaceae bacterium]MEA5065020.1 extracellular solute-binding protein [Eubacteriales bacterium]